MDRQEVERTAELPAGSTEGGDVDPLGEALLEAERARQAGDLQGLAEVLGRYPDFRAELEEMLELEDQFGIEAPPFDPLAGLPPGPPLLERYQLLGQIGEGTFGVVFRAREAGLGRQVALKVYRRGLDEAAALLRFLEEPQVASQLDHPGIPAVHAVGRMPDGKPYVAMRLIEGDTLRDRLRRRPPLPELLAVFRSVCQTIAYAHSRGVVHRDLKPANIMVGAFGEVQVMDWGLNRVLLSAEGAPRTTRQSPGAAPLFTQDGAQLGTPAYMPPEQARTSGAPTPASDVFALGAILCEMLTGRPPYCEEDGPDVLGAVARCDLAAAQRRLDACGQAPDLVSLALRCLRPLPHCRPTAAEMARAVEEHLVGLQRRLMEKQAEAARAWMYSVIVLLSSALLVGAAGVAAWVLADRWARQAGERARAEARREEAGKALDGAAQALRADQLPEATRLLAEANGLLGQDGDADQAEQAALLGRCLDFARECDLARQSMLDAGGLVGYSGPFARLGLELPDADHEAEFAARAKALPVRKQVLAALDQASLVVGHVGEQRRLMRLARLVAGGHSSHWARRFRSPEVRFSPAALARLADETAPENCSVQELQALAVALYRAKRPPGPLLRSGLVVYPGDFWLHLSLAWVERDLAHAQAALALRPESPAARLAAGECLLARGRAEQALPHLERALALERTPRAYLLRARCLLALDRPAEAENVCREARRLFGEHPALVECLAEARRRRMGVTSP